MALSTRTTSKSSKSSKKPVAKHSYRPIKYGIVSFRSTSEAARYMFKRTKKTKSEIARYLGVSPACVTIATRGM